MAYLNYVLAKEKGITPQDVNFLQIVSQNASGAMESVLKDLMDESDIASYDTLGWISFVKGKKSDSDFFRMRLTKKAKNILLQPNKSISEVAFELGFEYPQYFSRLFKRKTNF